MSINIKNIAIHHTAVSRLSNSSQLKAVNNYHRNKWNMKSTLGYYVGYNYFIDGNGDIYQTRVIGEETVAVKGHNCDIEKRCDTIHICLTGNFNHELPSDKQILALRKLLYQLNDKYPQSINLFHKDLQKNRTCPGILFTKEYFRVRIMEENRVDSGFDIEKAKQIQIQLDEARSLLAKLMLMIKRFYDK